MEQEICVENEPILIGGSGGAVNSVNGMTGDVVLTTSDLANTAGFQTANDVASAIASATSIIESRLDTVDASINSITALIPSQASASNQLADKGFVNSSVATNTANFVGTFNTVEELEAVQNPTNNDYGFVISTDTAGNVVYNRYKYIASTNTWAFEYALNNSSFTASQWAAIQSGITAALVGQITTNEDAISALRTALLGKQDTLTAGANVQIENNVISATDTVYTLPPATTSALGGVKVGEGLSVEADGTLSASGGGGGSATLYDGLGQNTDGAMTQKAVTDTLFVDGATARRIRIGSGAQAGGGLPEVAIGYNAKATAASSRATVVGVESTSSGTNSVAVGYASEVKHTASVALGYNSTTTRQGEVSIGGKGLQIGRATRYLANVTDGELDTDAATVGQLNSAIAALEARVAALEGN